MCFSETQTNTCDFNRVLRVVLRLGQTQFLLFILQILTSALTTLAFMMQLAVRIRLEVMNVTAEVVLLESIVKQVNSINNGLIFLFTCFLFS